MNILITIIAIVVVAIGVIYSHDRSQQTTPAPSEETQEVKVSPEEEPIFDEGEQPAPTKPPSPTPTPIPQPQQSQQNNSIQYPNSTFIRMEGSTLVYESNDNPDEITDWYKDQIQKMGMNTKSFVTTKTNDNVLNKLVGADGSREVQVEISKPAGSSPVTIKVSTG